VPENGMHGSRWRALETEQSRQPNTAALGKPGDLSPDLTYHCHRASARPYSLEFKREIVSLCQLPDNTVASVCKEYDLAESAVRRWVRQSEIDAGLKPGVTSGEVEEIARRKQLREVTEERDILARAVGFMQSRGLCGPAGGGGRDGGQGLGPAERGPGPASA
jgi:transposase